MHLTKKCNKCGMPDLRIVTVEYPNGEMADLCRECRKADGFCLGCDVLSQDEDGHEKGYCDRCLEEIEAAQ